MDEALENRFTTAFQGRFESILRWEQLDTLWDALGEDADGGWYIYTVGEAPPAHTVSGELLKTFLCEVHQLLLKEHTEDYCGIIYTDSLEAPQFVKIFDPDNLGVSCGCSDNPPLPGWVLSKLPPVELDSRATLTENRRRWWHGLLQN